MDTRNRTIKGTLENQYLVFKTRQPKTGLSISHFLQMGMGFLSDLPEAPVLISRIPIPAKASSCLFPQSSRSGNKTRLSARRKPLIVRVVRKASLALIFLTTLPLHPKNILMWIYIFWFSAGGYERNKGSFLFKDSRKVSGGYVG